MSNAASSSILAGSDPFESLLRHASDRLRALTAIASDPDVPAEDSKTARLAIERHIERTSGGRPAIAAPDAARAHLALERRLDAHAGAVRGNQQALIGRIVAALPATTPVAITLPTRLTAALVAAIAVGACATVILALPVFSWLNVGQAALLTAILIASLRREDTLTALRPMALIGTALTAATVVMGALLVPQFAMPLATLAVAWGLFLIGFGAFAFSWSSLLAPGTAIGWRTSGFIALVAGHALFAI